MRILQIVLPHATEFEKKSQRVDFAALSSKHEVVVADSARDAPRADVAHIYGPVPLPDAALIGFPTPYVASSTPSARRFAFRRARPPAVIVSPITAPDVQVVPEAVEEIYFTSATKAGGTPFLVGSYARAPLMNAVEQTLLRVGRFREDIRWTLYDRPPSPEDLAAVDVWVDPAVDEWDLDGFVSEAIAAGKIVAASRTAINSQRLEKGRVGFLVPPNDPNELSHAILAALFKPEVARSKIEAARQTAGKFRPRQRIRVLERIYETLIR